MTLEESVVVHRLQLLRLAAQLGSVTQACRQHGVFRTLFYRLRRRLLRYGEVGLRPRPSRSTRWARQSAPQLEHAVLSHALAWPTHGPQRIADALRQPGYGGWRLSASCAYAILKSFGLQTCWADPARGKEGVVAIRAAAAKRFLLVAGGLRDRSEGGRRRSLRGVAPTEPKWECAVSIARSWRPSASSTPSRMMTV